MKFSKTTDMKWDSCAGISKQAGEDFFIILEYYRHNWGFSNSEYEKFLEQLPLDSRLFKYMSFGMKKDYSALNLSWTWIEVIGLNLLALYGINDNTFLVYPALSYTANSWDASLGYAANFSKKNNREGYTALLFFGAAELKFRAYF